MTVPTGRSAVLIFAGCALAVAMLPGAMAQTPGSESKTTESRAPETSETFYLSNATGQFDLNDIQTALRNNFTRARIYGVAGQYALTVRATAEEMQEVKKMVAELDRPKKIYRVTYNVSDVENGKRAGAKHYAVVVGAGGKTVLRQGNRVPIVVGTSGEGAAAAQNSQVQYIDVGLNIEASIEGTALKTKIEQTSVSEEKPGAGVPDPVISQTMLEGTSGLSAGKPVVLGSLDVQGTTRRQEIEVMTELLPQ